MSDVYRPLVKWTVLTVVHNVVLLGEYCIDYIPAVNCCSDGSVVHKMFCGFLSSKLSPPSSHIIKWKFLLVRMNREMWYCDAYKHLFGAIYGTGNWV